MQVQTIVYPLPSVKLLLTVNEAAVALSLRRSTMYALLLSGEIRLQAMLGTFAFSPALAVTLGYGL
jgi:excisionase family DNA binding protein